MIDTIQQVTLKSSLTPFIFSKTAMKAINKNTFTAFFFGVALLTISPALAQQSFSGEAAWRRLSQLAKEAWDRGDPVAACRQSIHAAHLMNGPKSNNWDKHEQNYWKTVVRYCKEAV